MIVCTKCGYCALNINEYVTLVPSFLKLMNEIGLYGREKYGDQSFDVKAKNGTLTRSMERVQPEEIAKHCANHVYDGAFKKPHDHFGDSTYNLAAAAFNAMMEYVYQQAEAKQ